MNKKKSDKIAEILKDLSVEFEHEFYYMNLHPEVAHNLVVKFTYKIATFVKAVKKSSPTLKVVEFASNENARFTATPNFKTGKYWLTLNENEEVMEIRVNGSVFNTIMSESKQRFAMSWFQTTDSNAPSCWLRLILLKFLLFILLTISFFNNLAKRAQYFKSPMIPSIQTS